MSRPDLLSGQQCAELRATILGGHPRAAEHLDALIDDRQRLAARSPAPSDETRLLTESAAASLHASEATLDADTLIRNLARAGRRAWDEGRYVDYQHFTHAIKALRARPLEDPEEKTNER